MTSPSGAAATHITVRVCPWSVVVTPIETNPPPGGGGGAPGRRAPPPPPREEFIVARNSSAAAAEEKEEDIVRGMRCWAATMATHAEAGAEIHDGRKSAREQC